MSKLPAETEELKILDKDEEMQDDGNYSNDEPENNINNTSSNFLENYFKYQNKMDDIVAEDSDNDVKTFRQQLDQILSNGQMKRIIEFFSFICSLTSFIIYIYTTYFPQEEFHWFKYFEYAVCAYFNMETLLNLYLAQHRLLYLFSMDTILDLFGSIFPYFSSIEIRVLEMVVEASYGSQILRITRFITKNLGLNDNEVARHLTIMVLSFLNLIIFVTCLFRVVELDAINEYIQNPSTKETNLTSQTKFHDFLYYIVITITTLGYGDIYPLTEQGRCVIVFLIVVTTYFVPMQTNELITILENSSIYSRAVYKSNLEVPHLVICGNVGVDALKNFCNELFHVDHGQSEKNAIILNSNMPSQEMRLFLHTGKYELNLKYLKGNPILEKDLERADILNAKASVIMTDKFTDDPHSIDHRNILMSLAIKKYFLQKEIYDSSLFIQLIKPENKIHYQSGLQSLNKGNKGSSDQVIIVEEIKMNLLSKSCLIPGIIPMITNLVRSSGSSDETEFTWLNEYLEGTGHEIYRAKLNESFKNNTFCQISQVIYEQYDAIAFALEIEVEGKTMISLNPGSFYIEKFIDERDDVKFYIYLICSDKEVADNIEAANVENESEEENESNGDDESNNCPKTMAKFRDYMKLKMEDIQQLDENNEMSNEPTEEEDDYFIIKDFVNNNVDVKKDSIRNSTVYRNHIVVCGTHPSLYYYILPLRARYLGRENLKYVVILTQDMPKDLWDSISRFENIILINGSPLNVEDLYRANIEYADKAVILENEQSKSSSSNNQMVDSETAFVYKAIKKCNPNIQIMTELVFDTNIEFLLTKSELAKLNTKEGISYESTSVFSAGEVYVSSIIDTLTCQAYYNKHIVTIIHQLLTGGKNASNSTLRSICENVGLKSSNLWQMPIPEKFINKTFLDLYREFCEKNLIALGLYRLPGARDNSNAYVYTKPTPETRLTHRDRIFVLGIDSIQNYHFEEEQQKGNNEQGDIEVEENSKTDEVIEPANEEYQQNYSPLQYMDEMLTEMERQVRNLTQLLDSAKNSIRESISNGIRQEITAILH